MFFLICFIILSCAYSAMAFFSDDRIDDNFSYRSLRVETIQTKRGGCYLEGEIVNNTNITQDDVSITFYAYDFFDHTLWKQTIHMGIIDPFYNSRKGHVFRKKLSHCEEPAKFRFQVTGVKGKDAEKAIKDKPKRKKSDN